MPLLLDLSDGLGRTLILAVYAGRRTATSVFLQRAALVTATVVYLIVGLLLTGVAVARSRLSRIPLSLSLIYLIVGIALGPLGFGLLNIHPVDDALLLERIAEIAVIVSVFTSGLKLRAAVGSNQWRLPVQLAVGSMVLTVGLVAAVGVVGLGLSLGAAVVLGAVLAPTDPVLASDVQMRAPSDGDVVRSGLTGEAGMNDGTAFPFLMLGLGLLGLHELGELGWRWVAVDVIWAITGGLAVGAALGWMTARGVLHLRSAHREAVGVDDFLALGLIALAYGTALLVHTYGFLAVFAAGVALRQVELNSTPSEVPPSDLIASAEEAEEDIATDRERAPSYMARAVLQFNEQLEHIGEVVVVVIVGSMLGSVSVPTEVVWLAPLLFIVIRPISVLAGSLGARASFADRGLMGWFGIRGIGSIYYLMFAIVHGLEPERAEALAGLTLTIVAISVVVHGISVTPLMKQRSGPDE